MMNYELGRFQADEALAQLAREYVQQIGVEKAAVRADTFERLAQGAQAECLAESFARTAQAIRDAIENARETKAA